MGRVILEQTPQFAPETIRILEGPKGLARFRDLFGDYYVCGYELGADAGACLSASARDSSKEQTLTVTVTVKVLWTSASASHTERSSSAEASSSMTFSGYNSLGNESESRSCESLSRVEQDQLGQVAGKWLKSIGALEDATRKKVKELSVYDGQRLPLSACAPICRSGLVVRLLMAPFSHLNELVKYAARGVGGSAFAFELPE